MTILLWLIHNVWRILPTEGRLIHSYPQVIPKNQDWCLTAPRCAMHFLQCVALCLPRLLPTRPPRVLAKTKDFSLAFEMTGECRFVGRIVIPIYAWLPADFMRSIQDQHTPVISSEAEISSNWPRLKVRDNWRILHFVQDDTVSRFCCQSHPVAGSHGHGRTRGPSRENSLLCCGQCPIAPP